MRRLKSDTLVKIDRPFAIFVEEDEVQCDGKPCWIAKIIGQGLDNYTFGESPYHAVTMAADVIKMLTGSCLLGQQPDWSIDTFLSPVRHEKTCEWWADGPCDSLDGCDPGPHPPAWECARCGEKARKTEFDGE